MNKYIIILSAYLLTFGNAYSIQFSDTKEPELMSQWIRCEGHSMIPGIQNGDIVKISPKPFEELVAGDVVIYKASRGKFVAHRIYSKNSTSWYAKGDQNGHTDKDIVTRFNYHGFVDFDAMYIKVKKTYWLNINGSMGKRIECETTLMDGSPVYESKKLSAAFEK